MTAPSKTQLSLLVCALCLGLPLAAGAQGTEERDVVAATEKLFEAMRARDAVALRARLHADARIISVKPNGDLAVRTGEEWIRGIAASPVIPDERMRAPEVRIAGPLATLWATYTFHRGKEFSHCGVDAFQYVRGGDGWRLITIAFTSRTTGCSSGDGPPAAENVPPIPAPGRLIDLGGWRVHLHCTGEPSPSQPVVILEAGAGGFSVDWSLVQPAVAKFARVCSYDRAGLGWSELGPRPRTLRQVVWELHALLAKAGERPPYVIAGHSYGGILARLYARTYPSEVAGMVLDESGHEAGVAVLRDGKMVRLAETATGAAVPPVRTSDPLRESDITGGIRTQIEAAAKAMAPRANDPPRDRLPPDAQRMRAWAFAQVKHWATNDNPFEGEELAAMLAERRKTPHPLGDLPLVVLSRGVPGGDPAVEDEHTKNQADLVRLSRRGTQVIARESGHQILLSQPDLVVAAIREVVQTVEKRP